LFNYAPGEMLKLVVMRGSKQIEINVTLAATTG